MNKFVKKLWEKKDSKKGFTLVELIVVLVILAILAAIMVPSLIGWIDKAREKEVVLSARNSFLAAQEVVFELYGENKTIPSETDISDALIKKITKETTSKSEVTHIVSDSGVIDGFAYWDGSKYGAKYDGTSWTVVTTNPTTN